MDNEVVIHVRAEDNSEAGFLSSRRRANRTASDIEGDFKRIAPGIGSDLGGGITSGLEGASSMMGPLLGAGAAVAAPILGSAIAGAVIGAAGIGGVIGGIMLVKDDPRIQAAGKGIGERLFADLKQDASVFVGPVLSALGQVKQAWGSLRPMFASIFKDSAGFVQPLVSGIIGAVKGVMGGIRDLVHNGGPVIDAIGTSFTRIGSAIGEVMTEISHHAKEGATGISQLTDIFVFLIRVAGGVVTALSTVMGWITSSYNETQKWLGRSVDATDAVGKMGDQSDKASGGLEALAKSLAGDSDSAEKASTSLDDMQKSLDEVTAASKNLYDAATSTGDAIDKATKAARENGRTLDANTEKGRANRTALSHLAAELKSQYDATVAVNGAGRVSWGVAERNREAFIRLAIQMGSTKGAARRLADEILGIPSKTVNIYLKYHRSVDGPEVLDGSGHRVGGYSASGGIVGAAVGGIHTGLRWVGEHGPELAQLPPGTRVSSNPDSMRMAAEASGGGGGATTIVVGSDGSKLGDLLVEVLRGAIRTKGNGNVQDFLGRRGA